MAFQKGYTPWNKNKKLSHETRSKMSVFQKARKRNSCSEETKKKISEANKGKKHTEKWKAMMSKIHSGVVFSDERRRKISESKIGKKRPPISEETRIKLRRAFSGKRNHQWKGGISFNPYPVEWTETLRLAIRQRDNFTCQKCGITEEEHLEKNGRVLSVNHIDFDKTNCDPKNLNTLCISCNVFVNTNREYWTNYFKQKLCV